MDAAQARELGERLRQRRQTLGLSIREVARQVEAPHTTIMRLEEGVYESPGPDKLSRLAEVLGLSLADVFALAGYVVPSELPSFRSYLESKYGQLPEDAREQLARSFERLAKRHGLSATDVSGEKGEANAGSAT